MPRRYRLKSRTPEEWARVRKGCGCLLVGLALAGVVWWWVR